MTLIQSCNWHDETILISSSNFINVRINFTEEGQVSSDDEEENSG